MTASTRFITNVIKQSKNMPQSIPSIFLLETWIELVHSRQCPDEPCSVAVKINTIFGSIAAAEIHLEKEKLMAISSKKLVSPNNQHL
jgi:hypothetical protein